MRRHSHRLHLASSDECRRSSVQARPRTRPPTSTATPRRPDARRARRRTRGKRERETRARVRRHRRHRPASRFERGETFGRRGSLWRVVAFSRRNARGVVAPSRRGRVGRDAVVIGTRRRRDDRARVRARVRRARVVAGADVVLGSTGTTSPVSFVPFVVLVGARRGRARERGDYRAHALGREQQAVRSQDAARGGAAGAASLSQRRLALRRRHVSMGR